MPPPDPGRFRPQRRRPRLPPPPPPLPRRALQHDPDANRTSAPPSALLSRPSRRAPSATPGHHREADAWRRSRVDRSGRGCGLPCCKKVLRHADGDPKGKATNGSEPRGHEAFVPGCRPDCVEDCKRHEHNAEHDLDEDRRPGRGPKEALHATHITEIPVGWALFLVVRGSVLESVACPTAASDRGSSVAHASPVLPRPARVPMHGWAVASAGWQMAHGWNSASSSRRGRRDGVAA
jgi:hypothetical protein